MGIYIRSMYMSGDLDPDSPAGILWYGKHLSAEERDRCRRNARWRRYWMLFGIPGSLTSDEVRRVVDDDGLWELWKKLDLEPMYISARDALDRESMIRF